MLRGCCLDIITLRAAYLLSRIAVSLGIVDSNGHNKPQSTTSPLDSVDIFVQNLPSHQHNVASVIPNNIYPQLGTSDVKCAQMIRAVALKLARLEIDQTEVALMTSILLMSPGMSIFKYHVLFVKSFTNSAFQSNNSDYIQSHAH